MKALLASILIGAMAAPALAQVSFEKVESRTGYKSVEEGDKGRLHIDEEWIRFVGEDGGEYVVPTASLTELYYSRVSGRRLKSAIFISPILFLSKGRKHYLTLSFEGEQTGAVELKLDKKNYRGLLRAMEQVTGLTVLYDQEGIKDTAQDVATREPSLGAVVEISSDPDGAEIEIDGEYSGSTPRVKSFEPGEYRIRVSKRGYDPWERTIVLAEGDALTMHAELPEQSAQR